MKTKYIKRGILALLISASQSLFAQEMEDSLIIDTEIVEIDSNQMDTLKIAGVTIIFPKRVKKELGDENNKTDKSDKKEVRKKKKKHSSFPNTQIGSLQFGFTNFYAVKDFSAAQPFGNLGLKNSKSFNINIGVIHKRLNIIGNNVRLIYGLGFDIYNFRFENKQVQLSSKAFPSILPNQTFNILDSTTNYTKNKLVNTYLEIPMIMSFNTNGREKSKALNIQAGVTGGYLIGAHTKVKASNPRKVTKERGDFNLNTFKLSAFAGLGYKGINVYAKYSLNPVFKTFGGSDVRNISFGINFRPY